MTELMYDHAMLALSHAEEDYKWHICRYTMEMESSLEEEVYLLAAIEEGLEKGEFTFFAQPQCNIVTGQIVGAEALVRWQKPDGEVFLPGGFIPVLEKNKMNRSIRSLCLGEGLSVAQRLVVMMDDFGCGYSSLNMLKNIPVDVLKLDMRFLQFKEEERQKSANILEAIINHCRLRSLRNC